MGIYSHVNPKRKGNSLDVKTVSNELRGKRALILDYMNDCPFIEYFELNNLNEETASIDIAFDTDLNTYKQGKNCD